jgi:hypothetical protein
MGIKDAGLLEVSMSARLEGDNRRGLSVPLTGIEFDLGSRID